MTTRERAREREREREKANVRARESEVRKVLLYKQRHPHYHIISERK